VDFPKKIRYFISLDFPAAYQITAVILMVMGNSKNSSVFNFAIILKSQKFDGCETYVYDSIVILSIIRRCTATLHNVSAAMDNFIMIIIIINNNK